MTLVDEPPVETPRDPVQDALDALFRMLSPKQLTSITRSVDYTIALWVGAVSAGKTFASLIAFLIAIRNVPQGERIIIVGRTLKTIEGNVLSLLMDPKRFGILSQAVIHTTGASTAIILGRVVELIGAPTVLAEGNIRGGTIALVYVDEVTLIPETFFDMLETRLRIRGARMIATTNPGSFNHWLRAKYIANPADHDMIVFHLTMRDNPLYWIGGEVGPSYILRMIRANVGMFFQRFILGLWTNAAGAIYDMWDPAVHVVPWADMPPIGRILGVGVDYGASHATSAIMIGVTDEYDARGKPAPRLILIDEWRHKTDPEAGVASMPPSIMAGEIARWKSRVAFELGHPNPPLVFVDPSAKGFRDEFMLHRIATVPAENDVTRGIAQIASLLTGDRPLMIVTDRVQGWIEEVTEYVWNAKKTAEGEDEPVKEKDDSMDAGRYAVFSTRKIWRSMMRLAA